MLKPFSSQATEDAESDEEGDDEFSSNVPPVIAQGSTVSNAGKVSYPDARKPENFEPVSYHTMPLEFYEELHASFGVKELVDLAAGGGQAAKAFLRMKKPYVGVCCSEFHRAALENHLKDTVLKWFTDPESKHFQPSMNANRKKSEDDQKPLKDEIQVTKGKTEKKHKRKKDGSDDNDSECDESVSDARKKSKKKKKHKKKKDSSADSGSSA